MPNPAITTNYAGITQPEILQLLILGNEAFEKKSFMFHEDIDDKGLELSRLQSSADIIQSYSALPSTPSNALSFTPRRIDPIEMMIFDLINPKEFRSYWKQYQPDSQALDDKVIQPEIQAAIVVNYAKRTDNQLGRLIWQGDKSTTGALKFIDGIVTIALADSGVQKPTPAGNITASNVIAVLTSLHALMSDALFSDPTVKIHMSTRDFRAYQDAIIALTYKGQAPAEEVKPVFKNMPIVYYSGFPNNYVLICKTGNSPQSGLHAGMNKAAESDDIRIERYRPEGDTYFLKANMSLAVNYGFSEEVFLYKPA